MAKMSKIRDKAVRALPNPIPIQAKMGTQFSAQTAKLIRSANSWFNSALVSNQMSGQNMGSKSSNNLEHLLLERLNVIKIVLYLLDGKVFAIRSCDEDWSDEAIDLHPNENLHWHTCARFQGQVAHVMVWVWIEDGVGTKLFK